MAIYVFEGDEELDYSTLGFRASPGDLLSASAAPDSRWSLNGDQGAAETVDRYTLGIVDPNFVEPGNQHILAWSDEDNSYVPEAPATLLASSEWDAGIAGRIEDAGSETAAALSASIEATAKTGGVRQTARTAGDGLAGFIDWNHKGISGYLVHLTTDAETVAGTAALGIGTDQGSGYGIVLSHKNSGGRGLSLSVHPGAGIGVYVTGRSSSVPAYFELNPGSGPVLLQAGSAPGFADGHTTAGSAVFTSATAAFTAADIGRAVTQVTSTGPADNPSGAIPGGATIVSVESATSVTLSANATATGTAIRFAISGRTKTSTESMLELRNESSVALHKLTKAGLTLTAGDAAQEALSVTGASGQSTNILGVRINGNASPFFLIANNGQLQNSGSAFIHNANALGGIPAQIMTYSDSQPAVALRRDAAKSGNLLEARGSGSTALSRINKDGYYITAKTAAPADADLSAGEMAFWFDSTNGAAKLMVKAKEAGGTVRTGQVALS